VYYSKEMALNISLSVSFDNIQDWEGTKKKKNRKVYSTKAYGKNHEVSQ
jgi:hypothetical protein